MQSLEVSGAVHPLGVKGLSNHTQKSSTCEANGSSSSLEIPSMVWNPNVHCSTHKSSTTYPCPAPEQSSQGPNAVT